MRETSNDTFCLLFDSDGTLVDSELLNCEAMSAELAVSGIVEHPEHLLHNFRGYMFSAVLDELQQKHQIELDDGFNQRFRERAAEHFVGRLQPVTGVPGSLAQLSNPMCVVSNGPESKLELALRLTGLNSHFDHVFSAYTVGSWKPEPDLFHHAAEQMGYAADRCIVVEDSRVGIEAACAAGMKSILYSPEPPGSEPHVSAASIVIASMAELPDAVFHLQNGYGES
jgi:HAD superfamily hydrolase (TIGR01509 family)